MDEGRHRRVLVVNDDASLAESVCRLLREEDYEARLALDGQAALETFAEWSADLVLLDLIMPRLDGWRFLESRYRHHRTQGSRGATQSRG